MPIVVHQDYCHHIPELKPDHVYGPHRIFDDKHFAALPKGLPRVIVGPVNVPAVLALAEREYGRNPDGTLYAPPVEPKDIAAPDEEPAAAPPEKQ